jgi:hypothetical protein
VAITDEGVTMFSLPSLSLRGQAFRTKGAIALSWHPEWRLLAVSRPGGLGKPNQCATPPVCRVTHHPLPPACAPLQPLCACHVRATAATVRLPRLCCGRCAMLCCAVLCCAMRPAPCSSQQVPVSQRLTQAQKRLPI